MTPTSRRCDEIGLPVEGLRNRNCNHMTQCTCADWMLTSFITDSVICSYSLTHQSSLILARWQANWPLYNIIYFICYNFLLHRGTNLMLYFYKFSACRYSSCFTASLIWYTKIFLVLVQLCQWWYYDMDLVTKDRYSNMDLTVFYYLIFEINTRQLDSWRATCFTCYKSYISYKCTISIEWECDSMASCSSAISVLEVSCAKIWCKFLARLSLALHNVVYKQQLSRCAMYMSDTPMDTPMASLGWKIDITGSAALL